jgi:hypothetical protein
MSSITDDTKSNTPNDEEYVEIRNKLKKEDIIEENTILNHELNSLISINLLHIISKNKLKLNYKTLLKKQKNHIFNIQKIPKLSIGDFIYRITYYTKISEVTLISSLILMERYCKNNNIILTVYNINRLLFISIMVNIKFMEDKHFLNSFYAMICDVKLSYLNKMEYEFLSGIQFQLLINKNVYYKYRNLILKQE